MNPLAARLLSVTAVLMALAAGPALAQAPFGPVVLADSSIVERWALANGLQVVTRSIPGTPAVAITLAYRFGIEDDPDDREGLAHLLGELVFTAPSGQLPGRQREDLDSQRPFGWSYPVNRHTTLLTEAAGVNQFPGVLAEMARRMQGVDIDRPTLERAVNVVKGELRNLIEGPPEVAAGYIARQVASGDSEQRIRRRLSGRDLERVTPEEAKQHLARVLVPSNAVLSLAGDLSRTDVKRLVESLFGAMPAGAARPAPVEDTLHAGDLLLRREGPRAVAVGLIAPSLSDSMHPAFYLASALVGAVADEFTRRLGGDQVRFQYGLFDDPELARLFPTVTDSLATTEEAAASVRRLTQAILGSPVSRRALDQARVRITYLMGGPMSRSMRQALRENPRFLLLHARAQASCALRGGAGFWDAYRERLERVSPAEAVVLLERILRPEFMVPVVLEPKGGD